MSALSNLPTDVLRATRDQVREVLLRSGETWLVHGPEGEPGPSLWEAGIGQVPLDTPRLISLWGRHPSPLNLGSFVARVMGLGQTRVLSEMDLERGFHVLTQRGKERGPALLIDAAERIAPEVLHYIQFAFMSAPTLQVVFVAGQDFRNRLSDFPFLQARLQPDLIVPALPTGASRLPPVAAANIGLRRDDYPANNARQCDMEHLNGDEPCLVQSYGAGEETCCSSLVGVEPDAASSGLER